MMKDKIELIRDGQRQALLTWHASDGEGGTIPIGMEFSDTLDDEMKQRITDICERPVNVREAGTVSKAFPGSSKHFLGLPRVLGRLGFRVRLF
jgi:hypothetical protein